MHRNAQRGVSGPMHYSESPRAGMPRSLHFCGSGAQTSQDRREGGARIHIFLPVPAHDRAQKGERGLRSHVQRGLRVVEAGPVTPLGMCASIAPARMGSCGVLISFAARSMSPSDQDVSTTPAMRRCNSSRSPFVPESLHFYESPPGRCLRVTRTSPPRRPCAGATRAARHSCPDPCIFTRPRAREGPDPCIFTSPAP